MSPELLVLSTTYKTRVALEKPCKKRQGIVIGQLKDSRRGRSDFGDNFPWARVRRQLRSHTLRHDPLVPKQRDISQGVDFSIAVSGASTA